MYNTSNDTVKYITNSGEIYPNIQWCINVESKNIISVQQKRHYMQLKPLEYPDVLVEIF